MLKTNTRLLYRGLTVSLLTVAVGMAPAVSISTPRRAEHPEGVLKLNNRTLVAGRSVEIGGDQFGGSAVLALVLIGLGGDVRLGEVTADSSGAFTESFAIPADLTMGSYRLVAIATDGDEVASLSVELAVAPDEPDAVESEPEEASEPSAEPLSLERARSLWVTGGTTVAIVFALVLGGLLLRQPKSAD